MRLPLLIGLCCTAVSVTSIAAQDPTAVQDTAFAVRDSAGIRIAESSSPLWTPETAWRLAEEPSIRFGGDREQGDPFLFRVSAARLLSDGGFLIANRGTDLRRYDRNGRLVWSTLFIGDNPRPVQPIGWIDLRAGDSIGAFGLELQNDRASRARYSVYSSEGRLRRVVTLQEERAGSWRPVGTLSDGSVLVTIVSEVVPRARTGRHRLIDTLVRSDLTGTTVATLGSFPGAEHFVVDPDSSFTADQPLQSVSREPPFQHKRFDVVRDKSFLSAFTEAFEVREHDALGQLRAIVRRTFDERPVTQAEIDAWRARRTIESPTDPMTAVMTFPATHPLLDQMMVDSGGNVWLRHTRLAEASGPFEWTVFGRDGRWLGSIMTPEHLAVLEIGEDYLLGMWREPEAAQSLALYPLIKP